MESKKDEILRLLRAGLTYLEITKEVGCAKSTISYHANKAGLSRPHYSHDNTKFNWPEIVAYYEAGHSPKECKDKFNISNGAWSAALKSKVKSRHRVLGIEELLTENSPHRRGHVKRRLLKEGILFNKCYECGHEPWWRGKPLVMVLDHINGVHNDNRLENLRMLCPHCNSQTETFAGRNKKYK